MTFEEWFEKSVTTEFGVKPNERYRSIARMWSQGAWGYQQAIIDDLKDQLENEKQRADEYFDRWDNLMKGSEG